MKGYVTVMTLLLLGTGCTTTSNQPSFEKAEVIERINGLSSTPEWATGEKTMVEQGGDVKFVSQVTMGGNARSEACLKAADLQGRSEMLQYIKTNITTSGQLNETDASSDPGYESLTAYLSQGKLSGLKVADRYWEKRVESSATGDRVLKLRCVSQLVVRKTELERQLREATSNAPKGNPEIREKLLNAQKQFIDGLNDQAAH